MSNYIKKIKTTTGDLPIDYNLLANIPCYYKRDIDENLNI